MERLKTIPKKKGTEINCNIRLNKKSNISFN